MLDLLEFVRDTLRNDATIKSYVGDPARVFLAYKPVTNPEVGGWPQITLNVSDGPTDSVCNTCHPTLYIDVWAKTVAGTSGGITVVKEITKRIYQLLDPAADLAGALKIYQIWKSNATLIYEDDTEVYHQSIIMDVEMDGYS